jgi:hypothetical protein
MLTIRPVAEHGTSDSIMLRFVDGTVGQVGLAFHVEGTVGRVGLASHVGCTGEIGNASEFCSLKNPKTYK